MATSRRIKLVGTLWFESNGAGRYAPCRRMNAPEGRVRLKNYHTGSVQMDVSKALFDLLLARGYIRPMDEIPTLPRGRLRKIEIGKLREDG